MVKKKKNKKRVILANIVSPFKSITEIDYKDVYKLKKLITTRGRIIESARSAMKQSFQRKIAKEIKKARYMGLLPFNEYS